MKFGVRLYQRYVPSSTRELVQGGFWGVAAGVASRLLTMVITFATARVLGRDQFGVLAIVQSTTNLFSPFAAFGLNTATAHHVAASAGDARRIRQVTRATLSVATITGIASALVAALAADLIARHALGDGRLATYLRIASVGILFTAGTGVYAGVLIGRKSFRPAASVNAAVSVGLGGATLLGALTAGVTGAAWGMVLGAVAGYLIARTTTVRVMPRADPRTREPIDFSIIWRFSLPTFFASAMYAPVNWVIAAIVVNQPGGYGELGVLNAALQWRTAILYVPAVLTSTALPLLSLAVAKNEPTEFRSVLTHAMVLNGFVAAVLALPLVAFPAAAMSLFGASFQAGATPLRLLALSGVLAAILGVLGNAFASRDRMWLAFLLNAAWALAVIPATWFLRSHGAAGAALAQLLAYVFHAGLSALAFIAILRYTQLNPSASTPGVLPGQLEAQP